MGRGVCSRSPATDPCGVRTGCWRRSLLIKGLNDSRKHAAKRAPKGMQWAVSLSDGDRGSARPAAVRFA